MHIAYLARAENALLASALEDELRFVLREDMRSGIVILRQVLVPLHHFAGEANDHVVLIGFSVNRDGAECGALDLHGLTLVLNLSTRLCLRLGSDAIGAARPRLLPVDRQIPDRSTPVADPSRCGVVVPARSAGPFCLVAPGRP